MDLIAILNFGDSDNDDEDESNHLPAVKKRKRNFVETELDVDILPEKAIEEETSFQKVSGNFGVQLQLIENKELLLKFLDGSFEFMLFQNRKDQTAARRFIDHQVERLFLGDVRFTREEREFLESMAEYIVRILHRIQCRKFVLDKDLYVPGNVDTFFVTARGKANEAQQQRISQENNKLFAARVRGLMSNWLGTTIGRSASLQESSSGRHAVHADEAEDDHMLNSIIKSMGNASISTPRHSEYSDNPEFNSIQEDVLRRLVQLRLEEEEDEQPCMILSSPPRTPCSSPPHSRSQSPDSRIVQRICDVLPIQEEPAEVIVPLPIPEDVRSSNDSRTRTRRAVSFEVHPTEIQLYSRISEDECYEDHIWRSTRHLAKKRMFYDTGKTIWHTTLDFSHCSDYLVKGTFDGQAGTRDFKKGVVGAYDNFEGWNLLPVTFLLPGQDTWPVDPNGEAQLALPTYAGLQHSLRFIRPKNEASRMTFFKEYVFECLCNFHSNCAGSESLGDLRNMVGRTHGRDTFLWNMEPVYDKLILSDSVMGMCNPKTLLNAALLVCHPHIESRDFIDLSFKFIRKLVKADLYSRRVAALNEELVNGVDESFAMYYDITDGKTIYNKNMEFDISGGVFLCFGHDILLFDKDLRDQWRTTHRGQRKKLNSHPLYKKARSTAFELQSAALARCIALTNKVIYELKQLWERKKWWDKPFPDVWLITIPEGRYGDFIMKGFNDMLRRAVDGVGIFKVPVKLMDWAAVVSKAHRHRQNNMRSTKAADVEKRLRYLFRLMRQKVDLRYRRSQEERHDAIKASHRNKIPGEFAERPMLP